MRSSLPGSQGAKLDSLSKKVGGALLVNFERHESLYAGGYCAYLSGAGQLRVRPNIDLMFVEQDLPEERFAFPRHQTYQTIVEVDGQPEWVEDVLVKLEAMHKLVRLE